MRVAAAIHAVSGRHLHLPLGHRRGHQLLAALLLGPRTGKNRRQGERGLGGLKCLQAAASFSITAGRCSLQLAYEPAVWQRACTHTHAPRPRPSPARTLRRAASTLRPPGVAMRARKPLTRARLLQDGRMRGTCGSRGVEWEQQAGCSAARGPRAAAKVHARSSPMPSQRMPGRSAALVLSPAGAAQRHAQALLVVALHQQAAAAALRQPLRRAQHHACAREQRGGAGGGSAADACGAGHASRPAPGSLRSCPAAALAAGQAQTAAKAIRHGLRQPPMTPPVALTREGCAEALQARHGGQEGALELLRPAAGGAQGLHTHSAGHRDAAGAEARRRRHEAA